MRKTCGTAEISPANPARECPHTRLHPSPDITGQTASTLTALHYRAACPGGHAACRAPR